MQKLGEINGLYHLDPAHSALGFTVRHAGLSRVRGTMDAFHGYAIIDADNAADSALMVRVSVASINTHVPDRDAHLRSGDFFDVATYPALTFVGTNFAIVDDDHVRIDGDLTIKDVTRPLSLTFEYTGGATDPFGNRRIGFEAEARISRADYGLTWNAALETGGWLVGDEITLELEVSAVQQANQDGSLDADQDVLAALVLEPTPEQVEAEVQRAREAARATEPTGGVRRGIDTTAADDRQSRPRRAMVDDEGTDAAETTTPTASRSSEPAPQRSAASDQRGGWWKRLTGR